MKKILSKALAVAISVSSFLTFSGFTYTPNELVNQETPKPAVFEVVGQGNVKRTNLTQANSKYYGESQSVQAYGKWGVGCVTWDADLLLTIDREMYKNYTNFKVTVEYFDYNSNNGTDINVLTHDIGAAAGAKNWHTIKYTNSHAWKTTSVICSNTDLDPTMINNANYPGNFVFKNGSKLVTLNDGTTYNGALIHKVVIEPISENDPAVFEVADNGAVSESNLVQYYPGGYNEVHTVGNKTGISRTASGQDLSFTIDTNLYKNKHKFKVLIEFYDSNDGTDNDKMAIKLDAGKVGGGVVTMYPKPWTNSKSWKLYEFTVDNVDVNNLTSIVNDKYKMNIKFKTDDHQQTLPDGTTFRGILVHKITIKPVDEEYTYSLRGVNDAPAAVYSVSEDEVKCNNLTCVNSFNTDVNNIITHTDSTGVTESGIPHTSVTTNTTNKEPLKINVDRTKFKHVHNVNVKIKWLDEKCSNADTWKRVELIYPSAETGNPAGVNVNATASAQSDTWKETMVTLTNVDFTRDCGTGWQAGANMMFHINSKINDFNTPNDPSDDYQGLLISSIEIIPIADYTFSDLVFKNENGDVVDHLVAGEKFYTDLTVSRFGGDSAENATLIVALFDNNNMIEKIAHCTESIEPDGSILLSTCFVNPDDVSGKYVKIFVWNDFGNMQALANTLRCE